MIQLRSRRSSTLKTIGEGCRMSSLALWATLLTATSSIIVCLAASPGGDDTYTRASDLDGQAFTQSVLFQLSARSARHCATACSQRPDCLSFTLGPSAACRGHAVAVSQDVARTPAAGSRSFLRTPQAKPASCVDSRSSIPVSGVVTIYPDNVTPVEVYCDQDTDGGGWAVFQRRQDGSVDFYRNWVDYQNGFGDLNGEFWIGLDALHTLTSSQPQELRVDLTKWDLTRVSASYSGFAISDGDDNYRLNYASFLGGTAGDSLKSPWHKGRQFSTKDADHDTSDYLHCAQRYQSAWWHGSCHESNLNGLYKTSSSAPAYDGLNWYTATAQGWTYSMKATEMKLRPS